MPSELIMIMLFIALLIGIADGKNKIKNRNMVIRKPQSLLSYLLGE